MGEGVGSPNRYYIRNSSVGVYPQNFKWPGVPVRGIAIPTLSFTHLSGVLIKLS